MTRRKNKHPKRAENARTVVVVKSSVVEMGREEEEEEPVLCVRISDVVGGQVENEKQEKKELTSLGGKGAKRKRTNECDVSGKKCDYPSKLVIHMRTHTGGKPFECDLCEKSFTKAGNLKSHMRTHTGEKPFECDLCEKRYRQRHALHDHKRRCH